MHEQNDNITHEYSSDVIRKFMKFLPPYKWQLCIVLICLAISIVSALYLPIIVKNTIDTIIFPQYHHLILSNDAQKILANTKHKGILINNDLFSIGSNLPHIQKLLPENSYELDDTETYYIIIPYTKNALNHIIQHTKHTPLYNTTTIALTHTALKQIPIQTQITLRSANLTHLGYNTLLYLLLLIIQLLSGYAHVIVMAYITQKIIKTIRLQLFSNTTHQSLAFLSGHPIGKLVTRLTNDVNTINQFFSSVFSTLLENIIRMIGILIVMFLINTKLSIITLITVIPILIILQIFRIQSLKAYRAVRKWISIVNTFLSEHLSGIEIVQIFTQEHTSKQKFNETNKKLLQANLFELNVFAIFRPLVTFFSYISIAIIIYFSVHQYMAHTITLGVIIIFINYIHQFYNPIQTIAEQFAIIQSAIAGGERIFYFLEQKQHIPDMGTQSLSAKHESIVFKNVHFSYTPEKQTITDINFQVPHGHIIAIVGYTGSGKSTLTNLLTRMWDIDSGSICIGDIDIRDIPLTTLRSHIQILQQDVFLFHTSIRENLCMGLEIDDALLWSALEMSQIASFIHSLPDGLDTILTEGAKNISAGQRQLLSFARLIIQDPRVIIMDEATADIDTNTEKKIQRALENLLINRTAIIIAHRLSTIKHADSILVLNDGKLIEQGSHTQLLEKKGTYYTLHELHQFNE